MKERRGWRKEGKVKKRKKRCRQVCDPFEELQGSGGGRREREDGCGNYGGMVTMEMTWNVRVAPGRPLRVIGPKPRPVPSKCLSQIPEFWNNKKEV